MGAEEVVAGLLAGEVQSPSQAIPPQKHGFYAWWCREKDLQKADPVIPFEPRQPVSAEWSLLYVGISPSRPGIDRNIAIRFEKDHKRGRIGSSTFRKSLASLLMAKMALRLQVGGSRPHLVSEAPLSEFIEASCGITFSPVEEPWLLEQSVIALLDPPLNISHGTHDFKETIRLQRREMREAWSSISE